MIEVQAPIEMAIFLLEKATYAFGSGWLLGISYVAIKQMTEKAT